MIILLDVTKICSKCNKELNIGEFSKDKSKKDGLCCKCKNCYKKDNSEYYKIHRKKRLEYQKEYNSNNKDEIKEYKREYTKSHKEERKRYCEINKESLKEYDKWYCENNKNKKIKYYKNYNKSKSLYYTYCNQLTIEEDPISDEDGYLKVRCTHCKEYFYPSNQEVKSRIGALNGRIKGERRLYCSEICKHSCPLYGFHPHQCFQPGTKEWEEYQKKKPSRDASIQRQWREMILERDGYKCVKCGVTENLTAHHVEGIHWNPLESLDLDIGVTLCEDCNRKVHSLEGCSYYDMRCKT